MRSLVYKTNKVSLGEAAMVDHYNLSFPHSGDSVTATSQIYPEVSVSSTTTAYLGRMSEL